MEFDFRCGGQPEVRLLNLEQIGCKLRQLAGGQQRLRVDEKRRQNLGVAVLACVDVQKEVCQGTLQASARTPVHSKARSRHLRGSGQIKNTGTLSHFPMCLWRKVKFRPRTPTADFDVFSRTVAHRHGRVGYVGYGEQELALSGVELRDTFVGLLD